MLLFLWRAVVHEPNNRSRGLLADTLVYRCGFAADKRIHRGRRGTVVREFDSKRDAVEWLSIPADGGGLQSAEPDSETAASQPDAALRDEGSGARALEAPVRPEYELVLRPEPVEHARQNLATAISSIRSRAGCDGYEFFISGKGNFRDALATLQPYKGNRRDAIRPTHYEALRQALLDTYGAILVEGQEADDAIGIRSTQLGSRGLIIAVDKDLDNIPGPHFNWVKNEHYNVTDEAALRNFYMQLLTGDATDHIPGIEGVGKITARKLLKSVSKPRGLWQTVLAEYIKHYPDGFLGKPTRDAVVEIGKLLYIRKYENEEWNPPC